MFALFGIGLAGGAALLLLAMVTSVRDLERERAALAFPDIMVEAGGIDHITPRNLFGAGPVVEVATHVPPGADQAVKPFPEAIAHAQRIGGVASATPYVLLVGVLRNGSHVQQVTVHGIDPAQERKAPAVPTLLAPGLLDALLRRPEGVVIGADAARRLGVLVGRTLQLVTPGGEVRSLVVAGTFRVGVPGLDRERCYVSLSLAQSLRGMRSDAATGLSVHLRNAADAAAVASELGRATGYEAMPRARLATRMFDREEWMMFGAIALAIALLLTIPFIGTTLLIPALNDGGRSGFRTRLLFESFMLGAAAGLLALALGAMAVVALDAGIPLPLAGADGGIRIEQVVPAIDGMVAGGIFGCVLLLSLAAAPLAAVAMRRGGAALQNREGAMSEGALPRLRSHRRSAGMVVSALSVAAALLLAALSLFDGLLRSFGERLTSVGPHVTMTAESPENVRRDLLVESGDGSPAAIELVKRVSREDRPRIRNAMTYVHAIEQLYGRRMTAVSPFLLTEAFVAFGAHQATIPIRGILPEHEQAMVDLDAHILAGSRRRLEMMWNSLLLGKRTADELGIRVGERLRLVSLTGDLYIVQVAGIYALGVESYDRGALVNLKLAQALEHALPGEANGIALQLRNGAESATVAAEIASLTGRRTETWEQTQATTLLACTILRDLFVACGALLVILAGLMCGYIMSLWSVRDRELQSAGRSRAGSVASRLIQGMVIGVLSGVVGIVLGAILTGLCSLLPTSLVPSGLMMFDFRTFPVVADPWYYLMAFGAAFIVPLLAALIVPGTNGTASIRTDVPSEPATL